jgi:tetratricopeptide (TPR) repeat protein
MIRTRLTSIVTVIAIAATTPSIRAQPSMPQDIDRVKQLYESAAYDEALAALDRLGLPDPAAPDQDVARKAGLEYRALCLLALDRTSEAEQAIEQLLGQDPAYWPSPGDTSPRFVAAVDRARNRIIPMLARRQYDSAKRDFDERRNGQAAAGFARVVALLDGPAVDRSALGSGDDLRTLAAGFLELSRLAAAPPQPAIKAAAPKVAMIYSAADPDVVPPVAMRQDLPPWKHGSLGIAVRFDGQIDVVIDETGKVESATIVKSIFSGYNDVAVAGAKGWVYSPATKDGVPVKFRRRVPVQLSVK